MRDCSLVVVLRGDLRLDLDTLVIHACHAGLGTLEDITGFELDAWQEHQYSTVVLECTGEDALVRMESLALGVGLSCFLVRDARRRAVALGLGPGMDLWRVTGRLQVWQRGDDASDDPVVVH